MYSFRNSSYRDVIVERRCLSKCLPLLCWFTSASVPPRVSTILPRYLNDSTSSSPSPSSMIGLSQVVLSLRILVFFLLIFSPTCAEIRARFVVLSCICRWLWVARSSEVIKLCQNFPLDSKWSSLWLWKGMVIASIPVSPLSWKFSVSWPSWMTLHGYQWAPHNVVIFSKVSPCPDCKGFLVVNKVDVSDEYRLFYYYPQCCNLVSTRSVLPKACLFFPQCFV